MAKIQNGFHGTAFPATMSTTQGGIVSPTLFNVVVDNAIRTWMAMTVEDKRVAHDRLGETVVRCLGIFYANDGMVGSRYADWLQHLMNVLVGLLRRYGLTANVAKSFTITCQPGALWLVIYAESKALKCMGVVDLYPVRL